MRSIKTRRTVIFVITALALVLAIWVYIAVPKGVAQMEILTTEGEIVADTLEMYVGTETQLSCRVKPAVFENRTVEYTVADEEIAMVDENGLVKAIKEGETLLTVECAGARKNYTIKAEMAVEDITGLDKEIALYEGDEFQLEPKVKMAKKGLEKPEVTFKVNRNTIASVDNNGLITALKEGETTITVTAGTVSKKIKIIVEESPVEVYTPAVTVNNDADNNDNNDAKKPAKKTGKKNGGNAGGGTGGNTGGNSSESDPGDGSDSSNPGGDTGSGSDRGSSDSGE